MTLKERIQTARLALGAQKADAIIAKCGPILRAQADALEAALVERIQRDDATAKPRGPRDILPDVCAVNKSREELTAGQKLCEEYARLETDDERRRFAVRNKSAIGKLGDLAVVCMLAAKPLSLRVRAGAQFSVTTPDAAGLKMNLNR